MLRNVQIKQGVQGLCTPFLCTSLKKTDIIYHGSYEAIEAVVIWKHYKLKQNRQSDNNKKRVERKYKDVIMNEIRKDILLIIKILTNSKELR